MNHLRRAAKNEPWMFAYMCRKFRELEGQCKEADFDLTLCLRFAARLEQLSPQEFADLAMAAWLAINSNGATQGAAASHQM